MPKKAKKKGAYPPLSSCTTEEERAAVVRKAMADGHSNKTAALALGLSKEQSGVIAGIRRRYNIPSTHRSTRGPMKNVIAIPVEETPAPPPVLAKAKAATAPFERRKMAVSEHDQCTHRDERGHRCAYQEVENGRCSLHPRK